MALAAMAASALAVAPAALADEPASAAVRQCTCSSAPSGEAHHRAEPADAQRAAREARADREDHDAFLQRVWTAP